jgi:hypothetical protein
MTNTIGVSIKSPTKVIASQSRIRRLGDLEDVNLDGNQDGSVIVYDSVTDQFVASQFGAKGLDGQPASFYLDYGNLTNAPTIPSNLSQLTNDAGYLTDLSQFDSDDLAEGTTNKYLTQTNFDAFFNPAFEESYRLFEGDLDESPIRDSVDNIQATSPITDALTDVLNVSNTDIFQVGQNLRIYGASADEFTLTFGSQINTVTKNGFTDVTGGASVSYRIAQFDLSNGKISPRSPESAIVSNIDFSLFNQDNNIQISFNRADVSYGILVYRKINTSDFVLIDILGQKQLQNLTSNLIYVDYGTFNFTSWSRKDGTDGSYSSTTGLIHFPLVASASPRRGWVNAVVKEIDVQTNQITLENSYFINATVTVSQNDTQLIQAAIDERVASGFDSLTLNARRYIVSRLQIPAQFSLYGRGSSTILKKLAWSIEADNRIVTTPNSSSSDMLLSNFSVDGNMQNQYLKNDIADLFANYAVDFRSESRSVGIDRVSISNIIGGGIAARRSSKLILTHSRIEDSGMSDFYEYSPLVADDGSDVTITNNVFRNFTSSVDLSVTDNGVFALNIVQNVGTGVLLFGSTFFLSTPNVIRGPAGEFIAGPDILNSEYDSINIILQPGATFVSDVYKYQENGLDFDLTANRALLSFRVDKLRQVDNVEELYGEVLIGGSKPIQRVIDVTLNATAGEFMFSMSASSVNQLLSTFSYSTLKATETNHKGLVYSALLTEYVPSGTVVGTPTIDGTQYIITLRDFSNISVGARVRMLNHGGTPNLNNLVGTVVEIDDTLIGSNPPEITITVDYGTTISIAGTAGQITVENTFILAKGRIF